LITLPFPRDSPGAFPACPKTACIYQKIFPGQIVAMLATRLTSVFRKRGISPQRTFAHCQPCKMLWAHTGRISARRACQKFWRQFAVRQHERQPRGAPLLPLHFEKPVAVAIFCANPQPAFITKINVHPKISFSVRAHGFVG
jgi:hypothetical protein